MGPYCLLQDFPVLHVKPILRKKLGFVAAIRM